MVVEESPVVSALLEYSNGRDPLLEVCAAVPKAEEAPRKFERLSPDVIAMDIRLPSMDGLEATRLVMSERVNPLW